MGSHTCDKRDPSPVGNTGAFQKDLLHSKGSSRKLRPEFPSSLLPSLSAMVTGQHSERTGVLGEEVRDIATGGVLHPDMQQFWDYQPEIQTIWMVNNASSGHKTGAIDWPGSELGYPELELWRVEPRVSIEAEALNA